MHPPLHIAFAAFAGFKPEAEAPPVAGQAAAPSDAEIAAMIEGQAKAPMDPTRAASAVIAKRMREGTL